MDFHQCSRYFVGMKLSGPESRARKIKAADALTHDTLAEPVFQFDPMTEIPEAAWEAIERWEKQWIESNDFMSRVLKENTWAIFFTALPKAAYLQMMNPKRFQFQSIRGLAVDSLTEDNYRKSEKRPDCFQLGLLNQIHTLPTPLLESRGKFVCQNGENVFGEALLERRAWNESHSSQKRYYEQPSVIQKLVDDFSEGKKPLQQLALYSAVLPELREHLGRFLSQMQAAKKELRAQVARAMKNPDEAHWEEIVEKAFTLTLLGNETEITDEGLVIKQRNVTPVQPTPTLPERPAI